MIAKMYGLSLLLFYTEKKRMLRSLQALGVVDINLTDTDTPRMQKARRDIAEIQKVLSLIEETKRSIPKDAELPHIELPAEFSAQLTVIQRLKDEKEHLESALRELKQELQRYEGWGEIPVEGIARLVRHGVRIHLFMGSERFFDQYDFGEHCVEVIARGGNTVRFAMVTLGSDAPIIPFQKLNVPARYVAEMVSQSEILSRRLGEANARIAALAGSVQQIMRSARLIETRRRFEHAKSSLAVDGSSTVFGLRGFFPASRRERVVRFLEHHRLAYTIDEPASEEAVPVKLVNGFWSRLFEPITRIFSLPAYRELDPTPFFAPFFTLFFAFCMGDVGYGILFLLVSVLLLMRRSLRAIGLLTLTLSFATILSGLLMNSFFGANLFVRDAQGLLPAGSSADIAVFAAYTIEGKTSFPAMTLSLLIGVMQIFVAFVLQAVNETLVLGWRYAFKALSMLMIAAAAFVLAAHTDFLRLGFNRTFAIGPLAVGKTLTAVPFVAAEAVLFAGLVAFFFFGSPDRKWWLRPLAALWDFYGFSTGLLGDFLSYIRLFALALAGGLLGNAFNQIAFMVLPKGTAGPDYTSPWIIATVLILILGHTLNFALGALGAFVHPLRLTFVEFYKNINFRGSGRPYRPFSRASSLN
ncbi:MAG: hypothetical protein U1F16_11050 [Turneriella sp.]